MQGIKGYNASILDYNGIRSKNVMLLIRNTMMNKFNINYTSNTPKI